LRNYEITYQPFKSAFLELSQRGLPIHIILEDKIYNAYQNFFKQLQNALSGEQNINIQSDDPMGTVYVHSKVMLNEEAFRIQTANLTKSSFESNREHFFFSKDEAVRDSLSQLFEKDWAGEKLNADQLHPNLVFCPINCRAVIETMLKKAEESIIIQTQYILDPAVLAILRQQSEKVDLHIIVADTVDNTEVVTYFGPAVARKLSSRYNHTKMILIDGKYLLLGSMNLSDNSLDNNREI
jgi:phosphatidylserine/phosphatidylglycerophosphate/cardiolipin synthase-like enzyme